MRHFIIKYTPPRETFLTDSTPTEDAAIERHFEYLQKLLQEKNLIMAGRTDDAAYGIAIFVAEDEKAAREIVDNDPAVMAEVFKGELKPFRLALYGLDR